MGMVRNGAGNIQAFPLDNGTNVYPTGVADLSIHSGTLIHMLEDGNITLTHNKGSIVIPAAGGTDWVVGDNIKTISIDSNCIVS
jgi:hypothetical protein